jgi:WD40 repeat protein
VGNIRTGEVHRISLSTRSHIHSARFVDVRESVYLVVASSIGVQVWSRDGMVLKYFLPLNSVVTGESELDAHYMDGVAGFSAGHICVGSSVGSVAVINCPTSDGERMSLQQPLVTKVGQGITAAASSSSRLVVGNELGDLFLFTPGEVFEQVFEFPGVGYPCTSVAIRDDVIVAAYSSGHIRLFRGSIQEMAIEITAHARIINAIALHPTLSTFASCGDDQFLNIWSLPDFKDKSEHNAELLFSERLPNRLLTGIGYFSEDRIGVASYDEDDLIMLAKC